MNDRSSLEGRPCRRCGCFVFGGNAFCPVCGAMVKKPRSAAAKCVIELLKCLGCYAVFLAVQSIVDLIYTVMISGFGTAGAGTDAEAFTSLYMTYIHEISILSGMLVLLVYVFIFRLQSKSLTKEISLKGLSPACAGAMTVYGFSFQMIIGIGLSILYFLMPFLSEHSGSDSVNAMFQTGSPVAQFLNIAVMTGIVEEVLFRGLIYRTLKGILPRGLAVFASAVVFGAAHMNLEQFFYTSLLGVLLALVYDRCDSIVAPIIVHIAFNGSSFVIAALRFEHDMPYIAMFIFAIGAALITTALLFFTQKEPFNRIKNN